MKKIYILLILVISISLTAFADGGRNVKNEISFEHKLDSEPIIKIDCSDICQLTIIDNSDNSIIFDETIDSDVEVSVKSGTTYFIRIEGVDGVVIKRLIIK